MTTAVTPAITVFRLFLIAVVVAFFVWILFWFDHETKHISDLFKTENLIAFAIYFVPSFLICTALYKRFVRKTNHYISVVKALLTGIPLSFTLVIIGLLMLRNA